MSDRASHDGMDAEVGSPVAGSVAESMIGTTREYSIFSLDPKGFVNSWNDKAEIIMGYSGEEIIGRHFSIFYPTDRVASGHPDSTLATAAQAGLHMDQGWRLRKDGSRFWAHVVLAAQRANDGSLLGFTKVSRDETEMRTRHQRSTRRFTDLFDLAPVGIGLFDDSDRVLHANGALCDLLGYRLNELHGMTGADLLFSGSEVDRGIPHAPTDSLGQQGMAERTLARRDGEPVVCEVRGAMSMEDDGHRFWQMVFQDVTQQRRDIEALHYRATHDDLTGLPNRAGTMLRLGQLLDAEDTKQIAVLYCDLDNFKRVNDSLGHQMGDELLGSLARRLVAGLPNECTAGRLFGDEYLIICSDLDAVGGLEQLLSRTSGLLDTVVPMGQQLIRSSASIGAALAEGNATTGADLLRFADAAMFEAKSKGTGGVSVASPDVINLLSAQVQLEGQLYEAIHNDELSLYYQPIVGGDGSVVMAEALVRWLHPQRGLIGPETILGVVEQGSMLRDLDRSVLRTALREAASWPQVGNRPVRVSVNLSSLLPDYTHFVSEISEIMSASGIEWNRVVLEVVETSLGDLPPRSREGMLTLSEQGVSFAVDDFGTGYSSLKRLKDLPAQFIKIDRQFVAGAENDPADFAIARAIVEMARGMGRRCVSEGVENENQFELLGRLGVDYFQGFLFSKPIPPNAFRALLD